MTKAESSKYLCATCGQPLFLSKEECREFIEKKMKEGFIVCRCCGVEKKIRKATGD
jgi:DNA-directed RNA polymerase subunit RPC12/RpoP